MSSKELTLAAANIQQLAAVEPKQASKQFELLASTLSDEQLVEVIEAMDIVSLTQINSQHDLSFPSIMTELMSPEHIRDIVCQQPLYWEEKIKTNADDLAHHTFEFLTYLIRSQDSTDKQIAILQCLAEDPAGLFYLSIPFIELYLTAPEQAETSEMETLHEEEEDLEVSLRLMERNLEDEVHNLSFDDPRSLLALIRYLTPEVERNIKHLIRNAESDWEAVIQTFASELVLQAKDKNATTDSGQMAEVDDMFSFLD